MVLPAIAAGVGAGVVGGILNYYAQKEQAGAIKDATATEQKALREIIQKLDSQWQLPEYQQEPLSFEETQLLQRYVPEIPQYVAERRPQLIKEAGAQQEKAAQQRALEQLQQRALSGDDAQARAAQEQALFEGRATGESLRQQALRDLAQRGLAGSGAEILSGVAAAAAGERQARQEALNIQAQQDARRQQALSQMANLASQMRGQERAVEASNVDIMNAFNQRVRPHVSEYSLGRQGVAFDRLDLDAWWAQHKSRNGRPARQPKGDNVWGEKERRACASAPGSGTSTGRSSVADPFTKALAKATSSKRRRSSPGTPSNSRPNCGTASDRAGRSVRRPHDT